MFDDVELTNAILEELSVVEMSATTSGGDLQIINPFSPEDIHTKYGTSMESIRSMIYNDERYTGLEAIITILSKELESHITSKMTIDDLSDVEITNLQNGDILQYNNGFWRNVEYTSGSGIPEIHDLISYHTVSGLTTGHFLKALSPTTFGFTSHGLTYSDVGAEPAFTKNTAFNKNFGSGHDDIPHGDHVHDYSTL
ncbi:MAG TPA: hypothetical protein PLI22_01405, partial [Caldisericia bacterium]|nr:hypothetical protein [Caldisericia bacterium]